MTQPDYNYHGHDSEHNVVAEMAGVIALIGRLPRCILYIGACCGYEAGLLAAMLPGAEVHVIEACEETYRNFLAESRPCCPQPNIRTALAAISDVSGQATLHLSPLNTCHSLLPQLDGGGPVGSREVTTVTITDYCQPRRIRPDILVLDTEGLALRALQGAGAYLDGVVAVLAETEPDGAAVFAGGDTDEAVDTFLRAAGFHRTSRVGTGPRQFNSVWVRG